MTDPPEFAEFLRRIRAGDEQAAAELVRRYESVVRREIRVRLSNPGLTRLLDSADICQSVLASFFVRAAAGQFDLDGPAQLVRLLVGMAQNKLASAARRELARKRDARRVTGADRMDAADPAASPSQVVAGRELLAAVRGRLTDEERRLADLRGEGRAWAEIAGEMGGTPDGRRVQLGRALDRVTRELGLDEDEGG